MGARRRTYLGRQVRKAARAMRPNRVAARFISGGRHQTFTAIVRSPFKARTLAGPAAMRKQHRKWDREETARRADVRKLQAAARRELLRERHAEERARRAEQRRGERLERPTNPRTGKPITWREAQAGVRGAEQVLKRIEDELAGKRPRPPKARPAKPEPSTPLERAIAEVLRTKPKPTRAKAARGKRVQPYPPIPAGTTPEPLGRPGRTLPGLIMAVACECNGTGRIPAYGPDGRTLAGTTSCPRHGRKARGTKKLTARRALIHAGLPGLAAWLERKSKPGSRTPDRKQDRAMTQASKRHRHTGPTRRCRRCELGLVNKALTEAIREQWITDRLEEIDDPVKQEKARRRLEREAQSRFPYERCRACKGLAVVPKAADAAWYDGAGLREVHEPTWREKATGKRTAAWRR